MKNQKGFSLIELLIVVVIIGIIAAIAIPNLIAARRSANEGSAQSVTRTMHSAQVTYQATNGGGQFASTVSELATAKLVDSQFVASGASVGNKSGYNFDTGSALFIKNTQPASFSISSYPSQPGAGVTQTGTRAFCMATEGVLWQWKPVPATGAAQAGSKLSNSAAVAACATAGSPAPEVVE